MSKISAAVVGCGYAGKRHARAYFEHENADIVAVCDREESKAKRLGREYNCKSYTDFKTMVEREKPDSVSVATPTSTHVGLIKQCLDKKIPVLCEKPLSFQFEEARNVVEYADSKGVPLGVNYNQHLSPLYRKLKEILDNREKVHYINITMVQEGPVKTGHGVPRDFLLHEANSHLFHTLFYLNGRITRLVSWFTSLDREIWSDLALLVRFENGALGSVTNSFRGGELESQHPFQYLDLTTEKERIVVNNLLDEMTIYPHGCLKSQTLRPSIFKDRSYDSMMLDSIQAWIDSLLENCTPPVGGRDALEVAGLCKMAKISFEKASWVDRRTVFSS